MTEDLKYLLESNDYWVIDDFISVPQDTTINGLLEEARSLGYKIQYRID